ncbi:CLUMA_CG012011, isoform A [Clunio marinus]|uniref:CLUMA_CG012011, isoform A n=1 Tax=Clunio marinus TaxID=568069 RepID=A0A1J1IG97_9DIPT|nr:CLUMA_CG012011, isoform A [Clunio marinus]
MVKIVNKRRKSKLEKDPIRQRMLHERYQHAKRLEHDYSHVFRKKTRLELIRLSLIICGIEFAYSAETAFVSPILLSIGIEHKHMTMVWALSPLIAFFVSPILGSISDRCGSRFGRRRPLIVVLSIGLILGLILAPWGRDIGAFLGDVGNGANISNITNNDPSKFEYKTVNAETKSSGFFYAIFFTVLGTLLLDFNADNCQTPSRAYLLDVCVPEEHAHALSTFTIMAGLGGCLGYALGAINWDTTIFANFIGDNIKTVFTLTTIIFIIAMLFTVTSFREIPLKLIESDEMLKPVTQVAVKKEKERLKALESINKVSKVIENGATISSTSNNKSDPNLSSISISSSDDDEDEPDESITLMMYLKSIIFMPKALRILCLTNLFSWMGQIPYLFYFTDFVGEAVYGGDPSASVDSPEYKLYDAGIRFGCWGLALDSLSCAFYSMIIERMIKRFTAKKIFVGAMLSFSISMAILEKFIQQKFGRNKTNEYTKMVRALSKRRKSVLENNPIRQRMLHERYQHAKRLEHDYSHVFRKKTRLELIRLSLIICGIEFAYSAETAFVSPILLSIGIEHKHMTMVWALSPLIAFFVSPILGSISDRCGSRFGRRRPLIVVLSIGLILGLILAPWGRDIGAFLGDVGNGANISNITNDDPSKFEYKTVNAETKSSGFFYAIFFTVLGTLLLDFNADNCQTPSRAYLLDVCVPEEHAHALSTFTIMAGLGSCLGYAIGAINWDTTIFANLIGDNIKTVFTLVTLIFIVAMLFTVTSFREIPLKLIESDEMLKPVTQVAVKKEKERLKALESINKVIENGATISSTSNNKSDPNLSSISISSSDDDEDEPDESITLMMYLKSIIFMPKALRILCLTNLFSWMGQIPYCLYFTDFVGETVFGGDPAANMNSPEYELYDAGIRFGCWGLAVYALSCAFYSMIIERMIKRFTAKKVFVGAMLNFSVAMAILVFTLVTLIFIVAMLFTVTSFREIPLKLIESDEMLKPVTQVAVKKEKERLKALESINKVSKVIENGATISSTSNNKSDPNLSSISISSSDDDEDEPDESITLMMYLKSIIFMPKALRILCLTNLFSWMGQIPYLFYFTDFVGEAVYGGDPSASVDSPEYKLYDAGIRFGCWGLALDSLSCAFYSMIIERMIKRFTAKKIFVGAMLSFSISMAILGYYPTKIGVLFFSTVSGIVYSTLFTIPFLLVAQYHGKGTLKVERPDNSAEKEKFIQQKFGRNKTNEYTKMVRALSKRRKSVLENNPIRQRMLHERYQHAKRLEHDYSHVFRKKTRLELIRLSLIICGIEFAYSAETAFVSPILLSIGIEHKHMTMVWALSPLIAFFVSPILGSISDRCGSRFGRRRPLIVVLSIGLILGLILAPWGRDIGAFLGDVGNGANISNITNDDPSKFEYKTVNAETKSSGFFYAIFFTVLGTLLLDFNADNCQTPSRAYLLDVCVPEEHAHALSTFTIMAGLGGCFGMIKRFTAKKVFVGAMLNFSVAMAILGYYPTKLGVLVFSSAAGIVYATLFNIPFLLVAQYHGKGTFKIKRVDSSPDTAEPPVEFERGLGTDCGIVGSMLFVAQFTMSLSIGSFITLIDSVAAVLYAASFFSLLAAISGCYVVYMDI